MKFLLIESTNNHADVNSPHAEWGVSFTSSNPKAEDYVACKTEWDARRLCDKLNGMLSALAATVECGIYETQVLPTIAAAVRAPELVSG